ncbi:hypothetical protein EDC01DRAFT_679369 [Geopyxis carbonaria]|nr:hypothetical protein EDC01DRAFT_679369 [Geopyxis carbonaria]
MKFITASVLSLLASIVTAAADPVCTQTDNAPFLADSQVALDTLNDISAACGTEGFTTIENFVLSAIIRTYSKNGTVYCIDRDAIKAGAKAVIENCVFTSPAGGNERVEGYLDLGGGDEVSVEWSACDGSC